MVQAGDEDSRGTAVPKSPIFVFAQGKREMEALSVCVCVFKGVSTGAKPALHGKRSHAYFAHSHWLRATKLHADKPMLVFEPVRPCRIGLLTVVWHLSRLF